MVVLGKFGQCQACIPQFPVSLYVTSTFTPCLTLSYVSCLKFISWQLSRLDVVSGLHMRHCSLGEMSHAWRETDTGMVCTQLFICYLTVMDAHTHTRKHTHTAWNYGREALQWHFTIWVTGIFHWKIGVFANCLSVNCWFSYSAEAWYISRH